jgi:hypothetical protein
MTASAAAACGRFSKSSTLAATGNAIASAQATWNAP